MSYLAKAIKKLRPSAEFTFVEEDYSTIEWHILEGKAPTEEEIDIALAEVKNDELAAQNELLAKKTAAEQKLLALGLTIEDLKALGLA